MSDGVRPYSFVISREQYQELLKTLGSKANVILYINETYSLMRHVADIQIKGD